MLSTFDYYDEDETRINEVLRKYNNRKRQSMVPSPYALFFIDKGEYIIHKIYDETSIKPSGDNAIRRLHFEWNHLTINERRIYMCASFRLGYKPDTSKSKVFIDKIRKKTRVSELRDFLTLFTFN